MISDNIMEEQKSLFNRVQSGSGHGFIILDPGCLKSILFFLFLQEEVLCT